MDGGVTYQLVRPGVMGDHSWAVATYYAAPIDRLKPALMIAVPVLDGESDTNALARVYQHARSYFPSLDHDEHV